MTAPVLRLDLEGLSLGGQPVLAGVQLALYPGETLALTGPSGVGKTSLLRILARLERGFAGRLEGSAKLAMVFQEPTLLPWRTLRDNLCLTCKITPEAAEAMLERVGLGGLGARFPGQTSLGQQRRLALARAFACNPDVLLLDEPFVSLDPALVEDMMALFEQLRAGTQVATVLVTHIRSEADRLADRVCRLEGKPATLAA